MVSNRLTIASVLAEEIRMSEAGITNDDQITAYKTFSATIDESGMINASTYPFSRVDVYPVVAGTSYVLYGSSVRLYSNAPLVCFDDELFDGTNTLKCEKSLIDGTAWETNYNYVYTPEANEYIYCKIWFVSFR